MVAHTGKLSTWEAEARVSRVRGHLCGKTLSQKCKVQSPVVVAPALRRERLVDFCELRPGWSTERVLEEPGLYRETLSGGGWES